MLIKLLFSMLALMLTALFVPGIYITGFWPGLFAALILGLVNAFLKPLVIILTLPITILTMGLFYFVINGLMLYLTSFLVDGFFITNIFAAIFGALILGILNALLS